ncbi:hypothetical protein ACGFX4_19360 [Kitasatospora sp. NPDC048365]|uniref:hypothetical protein n=1 Tax=Kitasatospora sp. NPDC048365 TaxID=3364050 RepID=UPI003711AA0F
MPDAVALALVALAAAGCAVVATLLIFRRRPRGLVKAFGDESRRTSLAPVADPQVLVVPGFSDDEMYVFGAPEHLDAFGTTVVETPAQLGSWATRAKAAVDGVQTYQQMVGRLMLVDPETAAAVRAGRMAKDRAGEVLAVVRNGKGRFEHVTRLREVGSLASAAAMTNALSAMALQAQLDRIEKQLTTVSEQIGSVQRKQVREWHSEARAAQLQLAEVYRTARSAGTLTGMNWRQIESSGILLRKHRLHDVEQLRDAISALEEVARDQTLRDRERSLTGAVDAIVAARAALEESSRSWVQFSALRLWRMALVDDPTLEPYRAELAEDIARQAETLDPLIERARAAIRQVADFRWWHRVRSPLVARRLPAKVEAAVAEVTAIDWTPLRLEPPRPAIGPPRDSPEGRDSEHAP